jgi:hypothetical protein
MAQDLMDAYLEAIEGDSGISTRGEVALANMLRW